MKGGDHGKPIMPMGGKNSATRVKAAGTVSGADVTRAGRKGPQQGYNASRAGKGTAVRAAGRNPARVPF